MSNAIAYLKYVKKGAIAAGVTFVGTLGAFLADGEYTGKEGVIALGAGLSAFAITYGFSNGPKPE